MNILVTGGSGYIGSHTIFELLNDGHEVTVVDNLSNSSRESLARVEKLTNKNIDFHEFDIRESEQLKTLFATNNFNAVIHFAGLKAVGESVPRALHYYSNNITGTLSLLDIMNEFEVRKLIFSSSATVYGNPNTLPIKENSRKIATNPYGQTKLMIEQMLEDIAATKEEWDITSLRYFNPIGAHKSGVIGEDPNGIPNNLVPFITQVAAKKLKKLYVFGNDYNTVDGTGVRDYIHVVDLAKAHLSALNQKPHINIYKAYNIGNGIGISVLQAIKYFEEATGIKIPYTITNRRQGDIAECIADPSLANTELGWSAKYSFKQAIIDAWRWQKKNPNGYEIIGKV